MNIYLLRHGETDWNREDRLQGHKDILLNQNGLMQIGETAEILAGLDLNIDVIIASPLLRARKSAEIVADRLGYDKADIVIEPLFIERSFGQAEGLVYQEIKEDFHAGLYPGVEPQKDLCERAENALQKTIDQYRERNILIVAHGAILKAVITSVTDGKLTYESNAVKVERAGVHLLKYADDNWKIFHYNADESKFKEILF